MDEVNPEEVDEGAILERMIAWRQRCRQHAWRKGRRSAWRGLGGNMREEARVFLCCVFYFNYLI